MHVRIEIEDVKQTIRVLNGLEPYDETMTLFYDESGNCRKLSLTNNGVNSVDSLRGDFILAGVAYDGTDNSIDLSGLYQALEYKEGQKELKFKHLYHNSLDFCSFIKSRRLTAFLHWLHNSGLFIHYSALNNLFYALVDIVDSLWADFPQCTIYFWDLKNALYDFTVEHCSEIIELLFRYQYPCITQIDLFCSELCNLISSYNVDSEPEAEFYLEMLRQMLKASGKKGKLVFAQNNVPYVLIKEYYQFYLERCIVFSHSKHYFDEEMSVQKQLCNIELYENGQLINNYSFEKSHENVFIQISDMVAGTLRKLFTFLDGLSFTKTQQLSIELNEVQRHNFMVILELISTSDKKSKFLIKNANTPKNINDRMTKLQILAGVISI